MSGYTKLFDSLLTSTIWCGQDSDTKVVWITMLAMVNRDGIVECTVPGLAKMAEVAVPKVQEALTKLSEPDSGSRNHENDGRRIEAVAEGWRLLNYDLYRWKSSPEENADRQRRYRLRKKRIAGELHKRNEALQICKNVTGSNATHIAEAYNPPYPPLQSNALLDCNGSHNSPSWKKQKPKAKVKSCPMPGCGKPLADGRTYCSDTCEQYAQFLNTKYGKS